MNVLILQHRRLQNEARHKAFRERSAQNNKTGGKSKGKKKGGQNTGPLSSSGAQEQSSLFDWVKPMPTKKSKKDKAVAKRKASAAAAASRAWVEMVWGPGKPKKS